MVQDQKPQGENRPGMRNGHMVSCVLFLYRCGHWKLTPGNTGDTHCDISAGSRICESGSNKPTIPNTCAHTTADSYTHAYPGTTVDSYTYARLTCTDSSVPTNAHTAAYADATPCTNTTPYTYTTSHTHATTYATTTAHADACAFVPGN